MSRKNANGGMTRREVMKSLALGGAALAAGPLAAATAPAAVSRKRPNILLIMSDQERNWIDLPSGLGLNAHEWLLERGSGFTNFNMHTTPCSPARSTIYCGQHTQHTGVTSNLGAPPFPKMKPVKTIGHLLREQGYYTAYKGKWHLSAVSENPTLTYGPFPSARNELEPFGFSDYSDVGISDGGTWAGYTLDGQTSSQASQWLSEKGRMDKPWMLAVNFVNPHDIVFFDDADHQLSKTRSTADFLSPMSPPPVDDLYNKNWDLPLPKSYYSDKLAGKPWAQTSYKEICAALFGRIDGDDEQRWRRYQSYYFNCIRDVDRHVLAVLETLRKLKLDENTIIIYTADHGDMLGAHGLRQKGPFMYKENVRVPFIVRHPDAKSGFQTSALGGAIDLAPTLLSFAGLSDEQRRQRYPDLKGHDLSAAVASASARTKRDAAGHLYDYNTTLYIDPEVAKTFFAMGVQASWWSTIKSSLEHGRVSVDLHNPGLFRGVNDGRYKFARYFAPSKHHIPKDWDTLVKNNQLELYDTQADPDEVVNLAAQPEKHKDLILSLNAKTNALIMDEIGFDDGREHPGPGFMYQL